jgi:[acyl-carrier-protein] S-malonyltransferase
MHEAGQMQAGSMAAIIGLDEALLAEICQKTEAVIANINSPGQIVISGGADNIKKAMEMATAAGASRAIELQVSGAFHSPLIRTAVAGMTKYLNETEFKDPAISIIGNTTGEPLTTAEAVKTELRNQLTNPVQWQRSIEYIYAKGVPTFIEIGPGRVLTGLIRRINKEARTINLNDLESIKILASE